MSRITVTQKLDALTGLRYVAALTVLLGHMGSWTPASAPSIKYVLARLPGIGMPLFFVLSGFLMTYNYLGVFAVKPLQSLRSFYVSRFARIYPMFLVTLFLTFAFQDSFFPDLLQHPRETLHCLAYDLTLTQSWVHGSVFMDTTHPRSITLAYHPVAWSVSTEVFFYMMFPLLAIVALPRVRSVRQVVWSTLGVVALFVGLNAAHARWIWDWDVFKGDYSNSTHRWLIYFSPYMRFGEFLVGCLTGRLFLLLADRQPGEPERRRAQSVFWLSVAGMIAITLAPNFKGAGFPRRIQHNLVLNIGIAPLCAVLIFCLARYRSLPRRLLSHPLPVLLGESSYCLYLVHLIIICIYGPMAWGGQTRLILAFKMLMLFTMLHALSVGLYQCIEVPARRYLRDLLDPRKPREASPPPVLADAVRIAA